MLGAMTALAFVAGVLWFLGVIDEVRAILVHPAGVVDAGAPIIAVSDAGLAADAGTAVVALDAGSADAGVVVDAGSADAGSAEPDVRKVFVIAPASIEWRDGDGDALIDGKGLLKLPRAERVVLAVDRKRSCTARVPLSDQLDHIDYTKLPRGKLMVKAKRGTEVFLGSDKIGTTPMKKEIEVFAGTCDLRTRLRGNERRQPVEIRAGRTTTVNVR
jgi:hypothetical protein